VPTDRRSSTWWFASLRQHVLLGGAALLVLGSANVVAQRQISSIQGKDLYKAYCARCHGAAGKGDGPRALQLKAPPPDLTGIAARHGGKYNRTAVEGMISGDSRSGWVTRDPESGRPVIRTTEGIDAMPPFCIVFRYMYSDQPTIIRIGALARHLESIQAKQ